MRNFLGEVYWTTFVKTILTNSLGELSWETPLGTTILDNNLGKLSWKVPWYMFLCCNTLVVNSLRPRRIFVFGLRLQANLTPLVQILADSHPPPNTVGEAVQTPLLLRGASDACLWQLHAQPGKMNRGSMKKQTPPELKGFIFKEVGLGIAKVRRC